MKRILPLLIILVSLALRTERIEKATAQKMAASFFDAPIDDIGLAMGSEETDTEIFYI